MQARRLETVFLVVALAACDKSRDAARGVPSTEIVKTTKPPPEIPACDPPCETGTCVEGVCAIDTIDWMKTAGGPCDVGERRAFHCMKSTAALASVWGSDVYTTDSAICAAALHAGKITLDGGDVAFEIRKGLPSYAGSTRNGFTTKPWGSYECSYSFLGARCASGLAKCGGLCIDLRTDPTSCGSCGNACKTDESCRKGACSPGLDADWTTSASAVSCAGTHTFVCPPRGGVTLGTVWGTTVYTHDSSICTAAVHAGVITFATGGTVTIEMSKGLPSYKSSTRNGVTTNTWAAWSCSFRFR